MMGRYIFSLIALTFFTGAVAQFRSAPPTEHYHLNPLLLPSPQKTFIRGLISDPVQNYRPSSPLLTNFYGNDWRSQNFSFWAGTVTTMSFNKGRFGTMYYWDVQGNLRGTRGFIDLSGKNKRGVKLIFPWRRF